MWRQAKLSPTWPWKLQHRQATWGQVLVVFQKESINMTALAGLHSLLGMLTFKVKSRWGLKTATSSDMAWLYICYIVRCELSTWSTWIYYQFTLLTAWLSWPDYFHGWAHSLGLTRQCHPVLCSVVQTQDPLCLWLLGKQTWYFTLFSSGNTGPGTACCSPQMKIFLHVPVWSLLCQYWTGFTNKPTGWFVSPKNRQPATRDVRTEMEMKSHKMTQCIRSLWQPGGNTRVFTLAGVFLGSSLCVVSKPDSHLKPKCCSLPTAVMVQHR